MRYYYLDASALAKEYLLEAGSTRVQAIIKSARASPPTARVLLSRHAQVEVSSAISSAERDRRIEPAHAADLLLRLRADFEGPARPFVIVELSDLIASDAAVRTREYGLRAGDAIQLATALASRASTPPDTEFVFVLCDDQLRRAARAENFLTEDPTESTLPSI